MKTFLKKTTSYSFRGLINEIMIKQNKELLYVIEWNKESNDILDLKKTHRYLDFFFQLLYL